MRHLPKTLIAAIILGWVLRVAAAAPFVVSDIRVEGLQRISAGTVFNYLPIKTGDTLDETATADAIRALFKSGFFKDIRIEREGETLVVFVTERPSIGNIDFSGNEDVETEDLLDQLKQINFSEGRVFNQADFDRVKQELQLFYFALGKYAVEIKTTVTPLERNRVGIMFDISEGRVARIKDINIVGNAIYDDDRLVDLFSLNSSGWLSWMSKNDQYSRQKLAADVETLRSFYLDRGYINFNIASTQVSLTPDKADVYITINVIEGDQYTISDIRLTGDLIVPEEALFENIIVSRGEVFSRKSITQSSIDLSSRLGEEGYAFANVNAIPEVDEETKQVSVTFFVDPGKRVYVRRINFSGNTKTRDVVMRREMRQFESSWISTSAVERSRVRLQRLGYFEEVSVETPAVSGSTDQVDIEFKVVERPSGNLAAGVGFSQSQGLVVNSSIAQENFLGTGHRVSANFTASSAFTRYGVSWTNPYFTEDGVSLTVDSYWRDTDAQQENVSDYTLQELAFGGTFGIPINEYDDVDLGVTIEHIEFTPGSNASDEVLDFRQQAGDQFSKLVFHGAFSRDSRNARFLPTEGGLSTVSAEIGIPGSDLAYYKLKVRHQQFFHIAQDFTLLLNGVVGYGDGLVDTNTLPIIDNFFAGGIRSVRGYEQNTLGPRDSKNEPLGGDLLMTGNAELMLPLPFLEDTRQARVTTFFDSGNVFGPSETFDLGEFRSSVGLSAIWLSPLGALTFSVAMPLNDQDGDKTQPFQFTFGTSF